MPGIRILARPPWAKWPWTPPGVKSDDPVADFRRLLSDVQPSVFRSMAAVARNWIHSYNDASHFQREWKWIRLWVPLQVRLFVEQVLWDMGGPWRKLVTGFRPIAGKPKA